MSIQIKQIPILIFFGWVVITLYSVATYSGDNFADVDGSGQQKAKVIFVISSDQNDGSFVFTEIFKRNIDHFMYMDDPLRAISEYFRDINASYDVKSASYEVKIEEFLKEIVACRYTENSDKYLKHLDPPKGIKSNCQPGEKGCGVLNSGLMNQVCRENRFKHFVIKLSRAQFRNIKSLSMMMDLKIPKMTKREIFYVDFIRDPRALIYAQIKSEKNYLTTRNYFLKEFCKGLSQIPVKLPHMSMVLRYEDLSQSAGSLIKFLDLPKSLESKFDQYLHSVDMPLRGKAPLNYQAIRKRNFDAKVRNWRKYLDFNVMSNVQRQCKDVLRLYGYTSFWVEEKMRNIHE